MRCVAIAGLALTAISACGQATPAPPRNLVTASYRFVRFHVPDSVSEPAVKTRIGDLTMRATYRQGSDTQATFTFQRNRQTIFSTEIADLDNPSGWVSLAPNNHSFAITWSDGGAIGNLHTRVFTLNGRGHVVERSEGIRVIQRTFSAKHDCATRGDNYSAVRWLSNTSLLIEASVYDTGDCDQLGYTDRFLLNVPTSRILQRVHVPDLP